MQEQEFSREYREREERYRSEAARFHSEEAALRQRIRADVSLTDEERESAYVEGYNGINGRFEELANNHARDLEEERRACERAVYSGTGDRFAEHLTAVADVPDERLQTLMATAAKTGQTDLERAVAMTALERQGYSPLFEEWARRNPETAEALQRMRGLPESDRLRTRTIAMRPFKADRPALEPTQADRDKAAEAALAAERQTASFFDRPIKGHVGRRTIR